MICVSNLFQRDSKAVVPRGHVGLQVVLIPRFVRSSEFTGNFLEQFGTALSAL